MKVTHLGKQDYQLVFNNMLHFSQIRTAETEDELWVVEHPPVFTQGMSGKAEHLLQQSDIPVIQVDRGGQITYHGPGQLIVYTLIDFKRLKITVRQLVSILENAIIDTLKQYHIHAQNDPKRPGVYIKNNKIASLGLRIKNGVVYHGLSLNVNMDLTPFSYINPCGYSGLEMTQMADFLNHCPTLNTVSQELVSRLTDALCQQKIQIEHVA